jgi:putative intracellular protease/amidase
VVVCAKGAKVVPDHTWETAPPMDVLVYPGGRGTRAQLGDQTYRDWVRKHAAAGTLMSSVCTGALVYADAGLLDGRPATTYWSDLDLLASLGRDIEVRAEDRFVDSGDVVTASGVSAGIDMALSSGRQAPFARQGQAGPPRHPVRPRPALLIFENCWMTSVARSGWLSGSSVAYAPG